MSALSNPATDASRELHIGGNRITVAGDLVCLHNGQSWDGPASKELLTVFEQVLADHSRLYIISVIEEPTNMDAATRRQFGTWLKTHTVDLVVVIGTPNLAVRGLIALTQSAIRLIGGHPIEIRVCKTHAEAQALIAADRARERR